MDPDFTDLDEYLDEHDLDGYLVVADESDANQRYLSGFTAPDPFTTLYDGEVHLLVSSLEYGRAEREARAATVERTADYDYRAKVQEHGASEAGHRIRTEFCDTYDVESVATPSDFPVGLADGLREQGISVAPDEDDVIQEIRAVKHEEELEHMRTAQRANERAMATAESLIADAEVADDGTLIYEGETLTSERVTEEIEVSLIREGHALDTTIVACGADAADPHDRGSGPLRANESIVIDIFPRSKATGYYADMTRTFVKGEPSDTIREWYDITQEAKEAALDTLEAGVSGSDVHDAVCDVYQDNGIPTLRDDPETSTGFIHTTGHGVGLDIHEFPRVSTTENELEAGMVVTIEPGVYDPEFGGVRIEDIVIVREDGYENYTEYPEQLVL
ncbi:M24 family metallopeptidase [Halosegnis longus]|uniref:Aminopeptidase P family protein n=1 Tax=Halosegnis longus TaxID=2216012 RepID=A0AAJ4R876_9EURY|nr:MULTISPECIES: Xaa-Pro peptidase family protein [Halobacteriales]RNJ26358.1 aminopeptidase P family protein [Salella cibi]